MASVVIITILLLTALLAPRFGVDTRDGRDWQPWEPAGSRFNR